VVLRQIVVAVPGALRRLGLRGLRAIPPAWATTSRRRYRLVSRATRAAWQDSVDYALDHAARHGWSRLVRARGPAGVGAWEGIPGHAAGGWAGLHGPELAWLGERGPEYVVPNAALRGGGAPESLTINVAVGGRVAEQIYVEGRDLAIRRGRAPAGVA
jgi:hypothetical protein